MFSLSVDLLTREDSFCVVIFFAITTKRAFSNSSERVDKVIIVSSAFTAMGTVMSERFFASLINAAKSFSSLNSRRA